MSVYASTSVVEAIRERMLWLKEQQTPVTMAKLAHAGGMQPSYVSNALKGRAHFNSDQIYRMAEALRFSEEEIDFLILLMEMERTSYQARKKKLKQRIDAFRNSKLRAESYLSTPVQQLNSDQAEKYYLDPFVQLLHLYLSSVEGKSSVMELAQRFWMTSFHAQRIVSLLEEIGFIQKEAGFYRVLVRGQHLARESHLCQAHQTMMRLKSLEHIQRLSPDKAYSFSATIASTPEVRIKIREEFLKFLKKCEKMIRAEGSGPLAQINFDLFPWDLE